jgi:hypothetical protein
MASKADSENDVILEMPQERIYEELSFIFKVKMKIVRRQLLSELQGNIRR